VSSLSGGDLRVNPAPAAETASPPPPAADVTGLAAAAASSGAEERSLHGIFLSLSSCLLYPPFKHPCNCNSELSRLWLDALDGDGMESSGGCLTWAAAPQICLRPTSSGALWVWCPLASSLEHGERIPYLRSCCDLGGDVSAGSQLQCRAAALYPLSPWGCAPGIVHALVKYVGPCYCPANCALVAQTARDGDAR
jgi:hypothetical protein